MKLLRNVKEIGKAIAVAGLLAACQNENGGLVKPTGDVGAPVTEKNAKLAADALLIEDGLKTLVYSTQGRPVLWKEVNAGGAYWEYSYTPSLITATENNPNSMGKVHTYKLNSLGQCVETTTDKTYIYEYNVYGKLIKCYNKFQPNERREFTYKVDAGGTSQTLDKVTFFDGNGVKTKELTYNYTAGGIIQDLAPLNPDCLPAGVTKYLPIFGSFSTKLVRLITEDTFLLNGAKMSTKGYIFNYDLNPDGRVKTVHRKDANEGFLSDINRKYAYPLAGV